MKTSVAFAYREIQFSEAEREGGWSREEGAEVAVGGHAIK